MFQRRMGGNDRDASGVSALNRKSGALISQQPYVQQTRGKHTNSNATSISATALRAQGLSTEMRGMRERARAQIKTQRLSG